MKNLIEEINLISDETYAKCQEMADIAERKGLKWLEMRATCKTNAETDQKWNASPDGRRENYLKWYIKGLSAKRGALMLEFRANANTGFL